MPPARRTSLLLVAALLAAGCAGGQSQAAGAPAVVPARPLAGLAAQRLLVAPVTAVGEGDPLGWAAGIPRRLEWLKALDREIAVELAARGLGNAWVFPDALLRSYERNRSLSPDPQRLASESLRSLGRLTGTERVPEPLASQLRTLVAVHDGRFVLLPLEVVFEPAGGGVAGGRARLRMAVVDARSTELRWLGDVSSDPAPELNPGVAVSLAARLADLIVAR